MPKPKGAPAGSKRTARHDVASVEPLRKAVDLERCFDGRDFATDSFQAAQRFTGRLSAGSRAE